MANWQFLNYSVPITESIKDNSDSLSIRGVAINETVTRNGVRYTAEELRTGAPSLNGKPILIDHNNSVNSIVGRLGNNHYFDETNKYIPFQGKIMDNAMAEKIRKGLVNSVSIGARVKDLIEEDYNGEKVITAKGIEFVELSLVGVPADPNAGIFAGFDMAVAEAFKLKQEELAIVEKEEVKIEEPIIESPKQNYNEGEKMDEEKNKILEADLASVKKSLQEKEEAYAKMAEENLKYKKAQEDLERERLINEQVEKRFKELSEKKATEGTTTKGKVNNEVEVPESLSEGVVFESDRGYGFYQKYDESKLKRLVR